jgi:cytidine deaminase
MHDPLIDAALQSRNRAHAPFSHFRVGAAVEDEQGRIFTGCNIENASFSLTICAERLAVFKACRQILWEFCSQAELLLLNLSGHRDLMRVSDIFPRPFDASLL